jgi:hypothetical protein
MPYLMENFILDGLTFVEELDFALFTQILGIGFIVFWLFVVGWVWFDASERYKSIWPRFLAIFLTLILNIFGFIIYLIIRPKVTIEESYWMDLERKYLKFEAAGLEDCPRCGEEVLPNFIHCPNCGKELRVKCKGCDIYLEPDWNVCPFCGVKQRDVKVVEAKNAGKKRKKKGKKRVPFAKKIALGYDGVIRFVGNLAGKRKKKASDAASKSKQNKKHSKNEYKPEENRKDSSKKGQSEQKNEAGQNGTTAQSEDKNKNQNKKQDKKNGKDKQKSDKKNNDSDNNQHREPREKSTEKADSKNNQN